MLGRSSIPTLFPPTSSVYSCTTLQHQLTPPIITLSLRASSYNSSPTPRPPHRAQPPSLLSSTFEQHLSHLRSTSAVHLHPLLHASPSPSLARSIGPRAQLRAKLIADLSSSTKQSTRRSRKTLSSCRTAPVDLSRARLRFPPSWRAIVSRRAPGRLPINRDAQAEGVRWAAGRRVERRELHHSLLCRRLCSTRLLGNLPQTAATGQLHLAPLCPTIDHQAPPPLNHLHYLPQHLLHSPPFPLIRRLASPTLPRRQPHSASGSATTATAHEARPAL